MMKHLHSLFILAMISLLCSCSGSHHYVTTSADIRVSVSPALTQMNGGETKQFSAAVSNATNPAVTWSVSGGGTISRTGLYTAPFPVGSNTQVRVLATSVEDPSKVGAASITLIPVSVSISPENPSAGLTSTQQFTAAVIGTTNTAVTWTLSGEGCSGATCGNISTTGLYRAPWCLPTPAAVTVTATSVADPAKSGSTVVTNVMAGPVLAGHYSMIFQGTDASGMTQTAGTFIAADGQITNGLEDVVRMSGAHPSVTFTGTYTSSCYARGTMTLNDSLAGTHSFAYALNSTGDQARFVEMDSTGERGAGRLARQAAVVGQITQAPGDFAFGFAGSVAQAPVGSLVADSPHPGGVYLGSERVGLIGHANLDGDGNISGTIDANYGGTTYADSDLSGTYNFDSNTGRGTAEFIAGAPLSRTFTLSFYPVTNDEAFWMSIDTPFPVEAPIRPIFGGQTLRQTGPFSLSSFSASTVFHVTGVAPTTENSDVMAGIIEGDGSGNISGGPVDENYDTTVRNFASVVGTYTVNETNGRGTAHLDFGGGATRDMTFYLVGPNTAFLLDGTASVAGPAAGVGFLEPRSGMPFANDDFTGAYCFGTTGLATWFVPVMSGIAIADGAGTVLGMGDESDIFGNYPGVEVMGGNYEMAESGRTTFGPMIFYMISPTRGLVFEASDTQHQPAVVMIER